MRSLVAVEVGTNRVESNQIRSRGELKRDSGRKVQDIIREMEQKTTDARRNAEVKRWERDKWRKDLEKNGVFSKGQVQKMICRLKKESDTLRTEFQGKNLRSKEHKIKKWKENSGVIKNVNKETEAEISKFSGLSVLNGKYRENTEEDVELFNVVGDVVLSDNERKVLNNNPKLAVLERFDVELLIREL